jgi:hypothetical protein
MFLNLLAFTDITGHRENPNRLAVTIAQEGQATHQRELMDEMHTPHTVIDQIMSPKQVVENHHYGI